MDSNWFKIWPGKLRTVAASLPTGLQGAYFMQIAMVYLDEGGLPSDNARIAFITKLPLDAVAEVAHFWEFLGYVEDNRLHLNCCDEILAERAHFSEKKALAGSMGGKAKAGTGKQNLAKPSKPKQNLAVLSNAKQSLANQTVIHTDIQDSVTNVTGANAPAPVVPQVDISQTPKSSQELKAILASRFADMLALDAPDAPRYKATTADYVQIEALWKRNLTAGRDGGQWAFTPDRVERALANYRASPVGKRTLASFAVDFRTWITGPLDQFGKPATGEKANGTGTHQPNTPAQQQWAAQIGNFGRNAKRIGGQSSGTES